MGKDYYEVLGVSKDADEDQLKKGAGRYQCCDCITSPVLNSDQEMRSMPDHSAVSVSPHTLELLSLTPFFCVMQLTGSWQ